MVRLQKNNNKWKLLIIILFCIPTLWMGCSKTNSNTYNPSLTNVKDLTTEASQLFSKLEISKSIMDTTTNTNTFKKAKTQFDTAKRNYELVYHIASTKELNNKYPIDDQQKILFICQSMEKKMQEYGKYAYIYDQVEREGLAVLINFNILKKELQISKTQKFNIYNSFKIVDDNISKYDKIRIAYNTLINIPNKDDIEYYSSYANAYQIIFVCANLEDIITIRSFIEKTADLYSNRKNKQYVKNNKLDINSLTKEFKSIGNRRELCDIYLPKETKRLPALEAFALTIR